MQRHELGLVKKWLMIVLGAVLILLGLITFWLPLPIGAPLLLLGTPLVVRYSPHGRRWFLQIKRQLFNRRR